MRPMTDWSGIRLAIFLGSLGSWMVVSVPDAIAGSPGRVAGTITISGTKVKAAGPKSDRDVVVYLERQDPGPSQPPAEHPRIDQKGLHFVPHVLAVEKGTTVDFLNSDEVDHNVNCVDDCCRVLEEPAGGKARFMDLGNWGKGDVRTFTFQQPGDGVLLCNLHPEMAAYIVVLDTPHFAVAGIDGESQTAEYRIEGVPPGTYTLKTWNKKCTSTDREITIVEGQETRGDIELQKKKKKRS